MRAGLHTAGSRSGRIAKRAADPDFGITYGFTMAWADVLLERDHHEFFELTDDNRRARLGRYLTKRRAVLADLVGVLKTLHLQKYGQAEEVSAATIHQLDDGLAAPLHY